MSTLIPLKHSDSAQQREQLHEAIPATGSLISGGYSVHDVNIKNPDHGMFQMVYDYPYLSSSANHIFDISLGHRSGSVATTLTTQNSKKNNIYSMYMQLLCGYDATGSARELGYSSSMDDTSTKIDFPMFLNLSRLLVKDEIEKGSFRLQFGTGSIPAVFSSDGNSYIEIGDYGATASFNSTNSPAGEYATLTTGNAGGPAVGTIFYQAGIVVLDVTQSLKRSEIDRPTTGSWVSGNAAGIPVFTDYGSAAASSSIQIVANGLRRRIYNISFNNTTELQSTEYFCRVAHHQANYSNNPTYLSSSQIRVKGTGAAGSKRNIPFSYITTVNLHGPDNEVLAVAKLSEPIKKTPNNDLTLRVRLDY